MKLLSTGMEVATVSNLFWVFGNRVYHRTDFWLSLSKHFLLLILSAFQCFIIAFYKSKFIFSPLMRSSWCLVLSAKSMSSFSLFHSAFEWSFSIDLFELYLSTRFWIAVSSFSLASGFKFSSFTVCFRLVKA